MGRAILMLQFALVISTADAQQPRRPVGSDAAQTEGEFSQAPNAANALGALVKGTPRDAVRVINTGNSRTAISYWDGSDWRDITIASTTHQDLRCEACRDKIDILFNDGRSQKALRAVVGSAYQLFWSNDRQAWDFAILSR
jgi:hypothetical protein